MPINTQPVEVVKEKNQNDTMLVPNSSIFSLTSGETAIDEWLVPGIVPLGKFILLHGPAGTGKTTSACHIADRVIAASGGTVVYANLEQKQGDIDEKKEDLSVPDDLFKVAIPIKNFSIFNESHQDEVLVFFEDLVAQGIDISMIIFDSLMAATQGELNQGTVGAAMLFFNRLAAKLNSTVLLIHHNNKDEGRKGQNKIFGSALIAGAVVMSWQIDEMEECALTRKLTVSKSNLRNFKVGDVIIVGQLPGREPILKRLESGRELDTVSMKLVDQCVTVILDELEDCEEKLADDVREVLLEIHGFSESTISRASKMIGVKKYQREGVRYWKLLKDSLIFDLLQAPEIKK